MRNFPVGFGICPCVLLESTRKCEFLCVCRKNPQGNSAHTRKLIWVSSSVITLYFYINTTYIDLNN
uniref:Uncharacterized protein n=1 Tax=Setaria viridis TaxID=4556 RepID=A0A4U6U737_SETVI|nr:hypothetical protein SEVIR_6G098700v2 [Setaria viridis]